MEVLLGTHKHYFCQLLDLHRTGPSAMFHKGVPHVLESTFTCPQVTLFTNTLQHLTLQLPRESTWQCFWPAEYLCLWVLRSLKSYQVSICGNFLLGRSQKCPHRCTHPLPKPSVCLFSFFSHFLKEEKKNG